MNALYRSANAKLAVIYGRRRVGKSALVEKFIANKPHIHFEGLEGVQTAGQISHVLNDLRKQVSQPLLDNVSFDSWTPLLDYLTEYFKQHKRKHVIFLDEFQWLAVNQSKLVSLIKNYWDRYWSKLNVMLILCGSVSSYMVRRVIRSKALYGRINWELCLQPITPKEVFLMLDSKRSNDEALLYSMVLGGIPRYLQEINPHKSFEQNINKLFLTKSALFVNEYERIFYGQFKEHRIYEMIARYLNEKPRTLDDVSKFTKLQPGGGLKLYLDNLEKAAFITSYIPYNKKLPGKLIKYKLTDEYLRFYFKFIEPNLRLISENKNRNLFDQLIKSSWSPWLGFAFENFCMKNAFYLAGVMGFSDKVLQWGPYFQQSDEQFQIDLVYLRSDNVITICELIYFAHPIGVGIIKEVERKCKLLTIPHGYTIESVLISRFGPDDSLKELKYFHHSILVDDFFNEE